MPSYLLVGAAVGIGVSFYHLHQHLHQRNSFSFKMRDKTASEITLLLEKKANPNDTYYGCTALKWAILHKKPANLIDILLSNGADPNVGNMFDSALSTDWYYAQTVVPLLASKGADINRAHPLRTPFEVSALKHRQGYSRGSLSLKSGPPLLTAVTSMRSDQIRLLVANKADLNIQIAHSCSLLGIAIVMQWENGVSELLTLRADPNVKHYDHYPLLYAVRSLPISLHDVIVKYSSDTTITDLSLFNSLKHEPLVTALLKAKADVDAQTENRSGDFPTSALHAASLYGDANIMSLLMNYGADVNALCWPDEKSILFDVLSMANLTGADIITTCVLLASASNFSVGEQGGPLLVLAVKRICEFGDIDTDPVSRPGPNASKILLEKILKPPNDVNYQCLEHGGNTALHYAEKYQRDDIKKLLDENNAKMIMNGSFKYPEPRNILPETWENRIAREKKEEEDRKKAAEEAKKAEEAKMAEEAKQAAEVANSWRA